MRPHVFSLLVILYLSSGASVPAEEVRFLPRRSGPLLSRPCGTAFGDNSKTHVRLLLRSASFRPEQRPLRLTGSLSVLLDESSRIIAADMNGDGISDLIVSRPRDPFIALATAKGDGTFEARLLPRRSPNEPFDEAIAVPGYDGEPSILAIAPAVAGREFEILRTRVGAGAGAAVPVRRFSDSTYHVENWGAPFFRLIESERNSRASEAWLFKGGEGWIRTNDRGPGIEFTAFGTGGLSVTPNAQTFYHVRHDDLIQIWIVMSGESRYVAMRPNPDVPREYAAGDIDGDGSADVAVLERGRFGRGVWVLRSRPDALIDLPAPGIAEAIGASRLLGAGDFDGDGADELLLRGGESLSMLRLIPDPPPLDGARVTAGAHEFPLDREGHAEIPASEAEKGIVIAAGGEAIRVDPIAGAHCSHSLAVFVDAPATPAGASRNAALFPCVAFNPQYRSGGKRWGRSPVCAAGFAGIEADRGGIVCCPLPEGAVDSAQARWYRSDRCPDGFVVTGVADDDHPIPRECPSCAQYLQCAPIDSRRFRLLPPGRGRLWGEGSRLGPGSRHLTRLEMPPGIREAVGREGWMSWDTDGCIGEPWGALLVGMNGEDCSKSLFSKLVPRDSAAQPAEPLFPFKSCRTSPDPFNPFADCND